MNAREMDARELMSLQRQRLARGTTRGAGRGDPMTSLRPAVLRLAGVLFLVGSLAAGCTRSDISVSEASGTETGALLLDLVERARIAAVRLSHAGQYFDAVGDGTVLDGWSGPQRVPESDLSFAWATGRRATVRLDLHDPASRRLHLRCQAAASDADATQTMTVTIDGVEAGVAELAASRFEVHSFDLPAEAAARGAVDISLDFAYLTAPIFYTPSAGAPLPADGERPEVAAACDYVAVTASSEPPASWQTPRLLDEYEARDDRLAQPAGSEVAFALTVPAAARLEYGVRGSEGSPPAGASDLRAEVSIRRPGHADDVFFREVVTGDATRWQADLASLAGEDVELIFRIVGDNEAYRGAEWISPRLYGDPGETDTTTNVVLIVADTLRADHLGSYGGQVRTPNLDALAASGVRFENAYSHAPMTVPSHSSMFTSLLPTEHGVLNNGYVLGDLHVTLPELLRAPGYRHTAAFISLGVLRSHFGVAQGFDEYHQRFGRDWWKTGEEINAEVVPWLQRSPPRPFFLWAHYSDPHAPYAAPDRELPSVRIRAGDQAPVTGVLNGRQIRLRVTVPPGGVDLAFSSPERPPPRARLAGFRSTDSRVTAACASRCEELPDGRSSVRYRVDVPGSLRLQNAADSPLRTTVSFQASDRPSADEIRRRYGEEVEYLDRQIGTLLSALREASRPEDTLIIFTADHGEDLFEHGPPGHVPYLYDTVIRIPLLVSWPGRVDPGRVVTEAVSHIDLLPTVLEWLRIPDPVSRSGRSLGPLLATDPTSSPQVPVMAETFRPEAPVDLKALVAGRRKLILAPADNGVQLFNLERDPGEREDLAARESGEATALSQQLGARLATARERALPSEQRAMTEEEIQRLRALGYLR